MKVVVYTLGCKVNQYESGQLVHLLKCRNIDVATKLVDADVFIVNTCAVTNEASSQSRQIIGKIHKISPNARILVIGCATQENVNQFANIEYVGFIDGTANKQAVIERIDLISKELSPLPLVYEESLSLHNNTKTRYFIKIQDGCNNFCSYCIVPYLRGRSRSRKIDNVVNEINANKEDFKEFILTGIDLSSYGIDIGSNLIELISAIDNKIRLRLGSLEVNIISQELLEKLKCKPNFCPQFHLSLQSGSDSVLKRMNRHYSTDEYLQKVKLIRSFYPNASITTDIIVGFPLESEVEFNETLEFVRKVGFSSIHVFPYSAKNGTVAFSLPQLDSSVVAERAKTLSSLAKNLSYEFNSSQLGSVGSVLIEQPKATMCNGYTSNFTKIYFEDKLKKGQLVKAVLKEIYLDGIKGEIVNE